MTQCSLQSCIQRVSYGALDAHSTLRAADACDLHRDHLLCARASVLQASHSSPSCILQLHREFAYIFIVSKAFRTIFQILIWFSIHVLRGTDRDVRCLRRQIGQGSYSSSLHVVAIVRRVTEFD
jgi:hypothetical protein